MYSYRSNAGAKPKPGINARTAEYWASKDCENSALKKEVARLKAENVMLWKRIGKFEAREQP